MLDPISPLFVQHHRPTLRWLRRCFPAVPAQDLEEAASQAWLEMLAAQTPSRRLLRLIAWRQVRGGCRRLAQRRISGAAWTEDLEPRAPPGQPWVVGLAARLERAFVEVGRLGGHQGSLLQAAVAEAIRSGEADGLVAARLGLRREQVNRGRQALRRALLEGVD